MRHKGRELRAPGDVWGWEMGGQEKHLPPGLSLVTLPQSWAGLSMLSPLGLALGEGSSQIPAGFTQL